MGIFNPLTLPREDFGEYGHAEIEILEHYYPSQKAALKAELEHYRHMMHKMRSECPQEGKSSNQGPTYWMLSEVLKKNEFKYFFPLMIKIIIEVVITLPVSNAWSESGFSYVKIIKSKQRSSFSNAMLDDAMNIVINGPGTSDPECKVLVTAAVKNWLAKKKRKKIHYTKSKSAEKHGDSVSAAAGWLVTSSTQTEETDEAAHQAEPTLEEPKANPQDIGVQVQEVGLLLGLEECNNESEMMHSDYDSAFESDGDF